MSLGSLADFTNGAAFKPTDWHEDGLPIIRIQNLSNPDRLPHRTRRVLPDRYRVTRGDLLVSWSATLDVFIWRGESAWLNQHIFKVHNVKTWVDPRFLYYLLLSEIETLKKGEHLHGSTMTHINRGPFLAHPVPVPPLQTQKDITRAIDRLFNEIDNGEVALAEARAGVETYRKALLKAAVTGKLTAEWRRDHPLEESGQDLLRRILEDRRARWEADPKNRKKRWREPHAPDLSVLPQLPIGWEWTTTDTLTTGDKGSIVIGPFGSDLKVSDYRPSGVPLVFVRHIRSEDFAGQRPQFITPEKAGQLRAHKAVEGDVLVTKMGDPPGDVAIYPNHKSAIITADCIRWRAHPDLNRQYLAAWIRSFWGQAWIASKTKGVAQQKITLELFKEMPVALPGSAEQAEIVGALDRGFRFIRETTPLTDPRPAAVLRQSILTAAFRGELA